MAAGRFGHRTAQRERIVLGQQPGADGGLPQQFGASALAQASVAQLLAGIRERRH